MITEGGNNHENGGISENCHDGEKRDFDNSLYSSGTLEDGRNDAVLESSTLPHFPAPSVHKSKRRNSMKQYQIQVEK